MSTVTAVVIGAGARGFSYAEYARSCPDQFKIVGVAEPQQFQRMKMQTMYDIPTSTTFTSWEAAAEVEKFADCALITTLDQMHKDPAIAFANKGYHILLEKPMACGASTGFADEAVQVTYSDCLEIVDVCRRNNVMLAVCHVLRYDRHALKISELIRSGVIGEVVNIQHMEPIGYWHFTHSYVRGKWGNAETTSFMLLAKCCHDLDLVQSWMGDRKCTAVSSFGSLKHFTKENKPENSGSRCLDCGVEKACPYSAKKIYLDRFLKGCTGWPLNAITDVPDIEHVTEALKTGPYGRCVYDCDNNVLDNQVVILQFEGGATVNLSTVAFTKKLCARETKIFGTKGQLTCDFDGSHVVQFDFLSNSETIHTLDGVGVGGGHSDADQATIRAFVKAVSCRDSSYILTGSEESLKSHRLCFAAEKSRLENRVVDLTKEEIIDG